MRRGDVLDHSRNGAGRLQARTSIRVEIGPEGLRVLGMRSGLPDDDAAGPTSLDCNCCKTALQDQARITSSEVRLPSSDHAGEATTSRIATAVMPITALAALMVAARRNWRSASISIWGMTESRNVVEIAPTKAPIRTLDCPSKTADP